MKRLYIISIILSLLIVLVFIRKEDFYVVQRGPKGDKGNTGPMGPRGIIGEEGPQGEPGKAGPMGPMGPMGPRGKEGPPGKTISVGNSGVHSIEGPAGKDGKDGKPGLQGPAGKDGKDGKPGPQGPAGKDGKPGPQGPAGKDGKDGRNGKDGKPGLQGPPGPRGQQGPQGPAGVITHGGKTVGAAGPQGIPGPAGKTGLQGHPGKDGRDGRDGKDGKDGSKGERGQTGLKGEVGKQGPKGDKGDTGLAGAPGIPGKAGPAGPAGPKGDRGLQGEQGPPGPNNIDIISANKQLCIGPADNRVCVTKDKFKALLRIETAPNNYMYYPKTHAKYPPIIYQNPFDALVTGSSTPVNKMRLKGSGFSSGWDITYYKNRLWHGRYMFHVGNGGNKYNGLEVNIPQIGTESMTLWLRFANDRWSGVQLLKENGENIGIYSDGKRELNQISPDGAAPERWAQHSWMPISVPKGGKYVITNPRNRDSWISGVAFSANPWNRASLSALTVHWGENGGPKATWDSDGWHYDPLARFDNNKNYIGIKWPCEPSNYDKIIYIIEHNSDWLGTQHGRVAVNGVEVDRFSTAFDNPFARHINSKMYNRFMGLVVPKNIINNDKWLSVDIDMRGANHNIYFREIGSFDYIP